jgi:hypothetical protein
LEDFEKEALIASGLTDKDRIEIYRGKLKELYREFLGSLKKANTDADADTLAKGLFDWLWRGRALRYERRGNFRLHCVIDNQLEADDRAVGNCLGLTLLYNCLIRKAGIRPRAVYLQDAFGIGPHVLTLLRMDKGPADVEHIFARGFDYKGHGSGTERTIWGERELVGEIYHSRGNALFEQGRLSEALIMYDFAANLNARHERIRLNRMILIHRMGMVDKR